MAGVPRDADALYVEDCRKVQNNTHAIQTATGQIRRLVGMLESEHDLQLCQQMVDQAVKQASETNVVLLRVKDHMRQAQSMSEANSRRMMYHKLADNLSITARVLEDVVRRFTARERTRLTSQGVRHPLWGGDPKPAEEHQEASLPRISAAGAGEHELGNLLGPKSQCGLEEELEAGRFAALQRVGQDVQSLQSIYTEHFLHAEDQQASLDTLESQMALAAIDTERAAVQIEHTKHAWGQRAKQKLRAAAGGTLALVAIVVFVVPS